MVIMDAVYGGDRLRELWQTIEQLHMSYLEMEESPEKLDHRSRLEYCIKDFLCMVAHHQKFYLTETLEVLDKSAALKKDFSGYKAATGFNSIQMYAGNLLAQPWRKEYRQIKTYCGFYKHQIEANLTGAEILFEVMGYKHYTSGVLLLEGPVCPDRVTGVSRDCLVAYVECQIIKAIWEEIPPALKTNWLEVLDFRKSHISSPEQAIRALNHRYQEKQYQARCHQAHITPVVQYPIHAPPMNYMYTPNPNYYTNCVQYVPVSCKHASPNGYGCSNGYVQHPVYDCGVPTGQLIEVEPARNGTYDTVDYGTAHKKKHPAVENDRSEDFENWDYVYRNLESQGYTKDLGERGDVLKRSKPTNLDEALQNLSVQDRPLKVDVEVRSHERKPSQGSSYDNVKPVVEKKKKITPTTLNNNVTVSTNEKWECKACTYHNERSKDICEMCSKSRVIVDQQMEIGGPQCSKCTLVNLKDARVCQACGASLKDSPTYI